MYLWEFLLEVLEDQELDLFCYWIDKPRREFCVKDPEEIAKLWGIMKQRPFMDKKKLLRAIRYYYNSELITKVRVIKNEFSESLHCQSFSGQSRRNSAGVVGRFGCLMNFMQRVIGNDQ